MESREPINLETDDFMDVQEAKTVASDFHGGQNSALYSFASTGKLFYPNIYYINELKKVTDESLEAYGDSQDAISDKYRLIEFFKVQPEQTDETLTENAKYKLFTNFMESLKDQNHTLIESIQTGFNCLYESSDNQYTDKYDSRTDSYTLTSQTPEFIIGIIKQSPTFQSALQENQVSPDAITKIEVSVSVDNAEGNGYYGGSKGSWDEPAEGAMFEDGIDAEISGMVISFSTAEQEHEIDVDEDTDPEIYETIKSIVEQNDDLHNKILDELEESREYDRADYEADAREARWERDLDRY